MNIRGEYKIVDINLVRPNTWNPKDDINENEENRVQYELLGKAMEKKGFILPVLVRSVGESYEILDGKHRYLQAREKGIDTIPVIDLGNVDDNEAKSITLDAEVIKVKINEIKLAELTKEVFNNLGNDIVKTAELLPFSEDEINDYVDLANFDWAQYTVNITSSAGTREDEQDVDQKEEQLFKTIEFKLAPDNYYKVLRLVENSKKKFLKEFIDFLNERDK